MAAKIWASWSSGKDSAFALNQLMSKPDYEVIGLLTTVNEAFGRVAMHSTREALLKLQAQRTGLSLHPISIPFPCSNEIYLQRMLAAIDKAKNYGVTHVMFGDIFLEDIRTYREKMLLPTGIKPIFPLWETPTGILAQNIISAGIKAVITCVDPKKLDPGFAGRLFNESFLADLPPTVDPCGENGEFHTFVYDAPMFRHPIDIQVGEIVERDGFVFADVLERV